MDNNLLKLVDNILPKWFLPLQSNLLENNYSSKTTFQTIFGTIIQKPQHSHWDASQQMKLLRNLCS